MVMLWREDLLVVRSHEAVLARVASFSFSDTQNNMYYGFRLCFPNHSIERRCSTGR
jgi:hypothetical protein